MKLFVRDRNPVTSVVSKNLPELDAETIEDIVVKIFIECQKLIISGQIPIQPQYTEWLETIAKKQCEKIQDEKEGKKRLGKILQDVSDFQFSLAVNEHTENELESYSNADLLEYFHQINQEIDTLFLDLVMTPTFGDDGQALDKRTLLATSTTIRNDLRKFNLDETVSPEELASETLEHARNKICQFKETSENGFIKWLYRLALNRVKDHGRIAGRDQDFHKKQRRAFLREQEGQKELEQEILESKTAWAFVYCLIQLCLKETEDVVKAIILFQASIGFKPQQIVSELQEDCSLNDLLMNGLKKSVCDHLTIPNDHETFLDDLFQPLFEKFQSSDLHNLNRLLGQRTVASILVGKDIHEYIQNVCRPQRNPLKQTINCTKENQQRF